jgi:hypothetical protein
MSLSRSVLVPGEDPSEVIAYPGRVIFDYAGQVTAE